MEVRDLSKERRFSPEKMVKANLFATDRMIVDVYGLEPGQAQKVHCHERSDKVYVVLEGRATVTIGEEERVLAKDESVLAPAGPPHGVRNDSGERLVLLVLMSPPPEHGPKK